MSSPNDIMTAESLPLGKTITLLRETAKGFVDRANQFQVNTEGRFLADRWISGFFNVRSVDQANATQVQENSEIPLDMRSSRQADEGHFAVRTETVRGFVNRGGRFQGSGDGKDLGDRLVSNWFNCRQTEPERTEE